MNREFWKSRRFEELDDGRIAEILTDFDKFLALVGSQFDAVVTREVDTGGELGVLFGVVCIIGGDELFHDVFRCFASSITSR